MAAEVEDKFKVEPPGTASALLRSLSNLHHVAQCDIFVGHEKDVGNTTWGRVFGGQVLAQALVAAQRTVPAEYSVHALHGFFILAGQSGVEILYEVSRVRDGRSFITRTVTARQRNAVIFELTASFHRREWGPEFQEPQPFLMAVVKARGFVGDSLPTPRELMDRGMALEPANGADNHGDCDSIYIDHGEYWALRYFRHRRRLPEDTPQSLHQAIFAWMTDSNMAGIVCMPHVMRDKRRFDMLFSIDHSIHFHREFRVDEWMLFYSLTTVSAGARGLCRLEVFSKEGHLVATVTQEALVRVPKKLAEEEMARLAAQGAAPQAKL